MQTDLCSNETHILLPMNTKRVPVSEKGDRERQHLGWKLYELDPDPVQASFVSIKKQATTPTRSPTPTRKYHPEETFAS